MQTTHSIPLLLSSSSLGPRGTHYSLITVNFTLRGKHTSHHLAISVGNVPAIEQFVIDHLPLGLLETRARTCYSSTKTRFATHSFALSDRERKRHLFDRHFPIIDAANEYGWFCFQLTIFQIQSCIKKACFGVL